MALAKTHHSKPVPEVEALPSEKVVERDGKKFIESTVNKPGDEKRHPEGIDLHVAVRIDMDKQFAR